MKITFNTKNTLIILFTFLVTLYLTIVVISNFLSKYEIVKIAEKKNDNPSLNNTTEKIEIKKFKKFLNDKNVNTDDLSNKDLASLYWVERIKDGGLILLFRHSEREKWKNTVEGFDAYELYNNYDARELSWYKATCLTEKGIEESKLIKEAFDHANIKISEVVTSPSCRARETAIYGFGKIDKIFSGLLHYSAFHPQDRKKLGNELKKAVIQLSLEQNKNIVLSAHNKVISHHNFIDEMNVNEGLEESGFYIIEKKENKLIVPYKFSVIKDFIILLYRHEFVKAG